MDPQPAAPQPTNTPEAPSAAPQAAPQAPLPAVPNPWPGGFGVYKHSKQAVLRNLPTFLGLIVASLVLSAIPYAVGDSARSIVNLITTILSLFVGVATIKTSIQSVRGETVPIGTALRYGLDFTLVLKYLVSAIVVGLLLLLSFVLLIVPYFFVLPRVLLFEYYLIDKNLGPIEAIKASWDATKGHSSKVWGVIGATIAMALLFLTIIGIPFALYFLFMYSTAFAVLYLFISNQQASEVGSVAASGPVAPIAPTAPAPPAPAV